jgi:hypothetical protein
VEYLRCSGFKSYAGQTITFERAADWYVAFVLPARESGQLALVDLGDAKRIDEAVLALRAAMPGVAPADAAPQDWRSAARAAAELVWDPVAPLLDLDAEVIVATDGQIGALPFDALVTANGQPLLTQLTITSLGTGRDARLLDFRPNWSSEEPVVIGPPEFGEPWAPFVPLPGTQGEANRVSKLLTASRSEASPVPAWRSARALVASIANSPRANFVSLKSALAGRGVGTRTARAPRGR